MVFDPSSESAEAGRGFQNAPIVAATTTNGHGEGAPRLDSAHRAKLQQSALTDQQIDRLGWISHLDGSLEIPYLRPDGTREVTHDGKPFSRLRLSPQQIANNPKGGKYRSPKGNGCRLFHSPLAIAAGDYQRRLSDRFIPLRITEGELKTVAANVHDPQRLTIGLGGVSSWRDRYDGQGKDEASQPLIDWDEIAVSGREVRICFDSDLRKPQVLAELRKLAEFLRSKGAHVLIEVLPHGLDGERLGLDDLIHRHGAAVFLQIAAIARCPFKTTKRETEWAFSPEPADTHQRNVYLCGLLGPMWRSSPDGKDRWVRWNGRHWEPVAGDDAIASAIEGFAELQGWANRELPTFRSLQAAFRRRLQASEAEQRRDLVPFANGCLRLEDRALVPHDPQHGNDWCLPFDYDPAATCPGIEALLIDRLEDPASVALFRAFARSLVITDERPKCFLEITGTSNTGKSVLSNLLTALVGKANTAAMTLQRLEDRSQRFETIKLRGARLAVFSECQDYSGQLQVLKSITGNDPIGAELKGGRHLDFTFTGGVVLVGNGPVRASDATGAVICRRRSLHVGKVVESKSERQLIEPDDAGGWRGELVPELAGFFNWVVAMPAAEARLALSRDVPSLARAEAELESLLETDHLAQWADQTLVWDGGVDSYLQVGTTVDEPGSALFASYLEHISQQGRNVPSLSLRVFKAKLIDLLRDTLGLPLPKGRTNRGPYRVRGKGSVVPCLRWRMVGEEPETVSGVIRHGFLARIAAADSATPGTDAERVGNGKTPVGNGWNGWNGSKEKEDKGETADSPPDVISPIGAKGNGKPVSSVPSVPYKGSQRSPSVPPSVPGGESVPLTALLPGTRVQLRHPSMGWQGGYEVVSGPGADGLVKIRSLSTGSTQHTRPRNLRADLEEAA